MALGGASVSHDSAGNVSNDQQSRTFAYDAAGMLRTATKGSVSASYIYSAEGLIRYRSVSGSVSRHLYDGDQEIYELNGAVAKTRRYVRLPGSVDAPFLMIDYRGSCNTSSGCEYWGSLGRGAPMNK